MAVYGEQEPPFTEDKRPQPIDPYGIAKYAVECDLKLAHEQFGLRYNIVRPHNVLGIYQFCWYHWFSVEWMDNGVYTISLLFKTLAMVVSN